MAEQDLLDRTRQELRQRLKELEPLVDEQRRLQRALEALEHMEGDRSSGRQARTETTPRRRTRRSSLRRAKRGERQEALVKAIRESPGSRPADLARSIEAAPSQTHSLLRQLQESEQVERREGGFFVREGPSGPGASSTNEPPEQAVPESSTADGTAGEELREQLSERILSRTEESQPE